MAVDPASMPSGYPVRFDIAYPEGENRFMILIRWLLAIPHLIILSGLRYVALAVVVFAFFAILFTGRHPAGLFRFQVGVLRWNQNVGAYVLFHNRYPPFSFDEGKYPPVTFQVDRAEHYNRFLPFIKWLLAIPHLIILSLLWVITVLLYVFTFLAVLVTGKYPRGPFNFIVGTSRWGARVTAYLMLVVDDYPPFSMKA